MALLKFKEEALSKEDLDRKVVVLLMNLIEERGETDPDCAYAHFKVKRIGRYLLGVGYYHEMDEYYYETGFEVEYEYRWPFMKKTETKIRFCSIWTDKTHHEMAPIDFCESYREFGDNHRFESGCGDHLEVERTLVSREEVEQLISKLCRGDSIEDLMNTIEKISSKRKS